MPSSSVMLMPVELCENSWPPTATSAPAGSDACERDARLLQGVDGRRQHGRAAHRELDRHECGGAVGAEVGRPGRVVRRARRRHLRDLLDGGDRILDRGLEVGIGHVAAVGGDGDELGRRAAHLRERTREGIERVLGFRAGNAVGVVGADAQQGGAREQQGQRDEPCRQHPSTRPERPAAERVERGGHEGHRSVRIGWGCPVRLWPRPTRGNLRVVPPVRGWRHDARHDRRRRRAVPRSTRAPRRPSRAGRAPRRRCAPGERRQLCDRTSRAYEAAFEAIDHDPAHTLVAVEDASGTVVATMQLTLIPGLARAGATRMQVEAVRVAGSARGHGLGTAMMRWAIDEARSRGAALVQLTSDARRVEPIGSTSDSASRRPTWGSSASLDVAPGSAGVARAACAPAPRPRRPSQLDSRDVFVAKSFSHEQGGRVKVVIVGAGIGGLATALSLERAGIPTSRGRARAGAAAAGRRHQPPPACGAGTDRAGPRRRGGRDRRAARHASRTSTGSASPSGASRAASTPATTGRSCRCIEASCSCCSPTRCAVASDPTRSGSAGEPRPSSTAARPTRRGSRMPRAPSSRSRPTWWWAPTASTRPCGAQALPRRGRAAVEPALLWRGTALAPTFLDGRTMVMAGDGEQKFVAYPLVAPGAEQGLTRVNFIAERRAPDGMSETADWNHPVDAAPIVELFARLAVRLARRAGRHRRRRRDPRIPDGGPRPACRAGRSVAPRCSAMPRTRSIRTAPTARPRRSSTRERSPSASPPFRTVEDALAAYEADRRPATTRAVLGRPGRGRSRSCCSPTSGRRLGSRDIHEVIPEQELARDRRLGTSGRPGSTPSSSTRGRRSPRRGDRERAEDRFDAAALSGLISPLRRGLLRAARAAEHLPDDPRRPDRGASAPFRRGTVPQPGRDRRGADAEPHDRQQPAAGRWRPPA